MKKGKVSRKDAKTQGRNWRRSCPRPCSPVMAGSKEMGSSSRPAWRGLEPVIVAAQDTQLLNDVVATGKPVCQREVEAERKVNNLSQG